VLGSSGEVAVADCMNHRVQIFDSEGNYKRQFGTEGKEADGQLFCNYKHQGGRRPVLLPYRPRLGRSRQLARDRLHQSTAGVRPRGQAPLHPQQPWTV
jgi:hypothetical protein